jgi:hypothetical protein
MSVVPVWSLGVTPPRPMASKPPRGMRERRALDGRCLPAAVDYRPPDCGRPGLRLSVTDKPSVAMSMPRDGVRLGRRRATPLPGGAPRGLTIRQAALVALLQIGSGRTARQGPTSTGRANPLNDAKILARIAFGSVSVVGNGGSPAPGSYLNARDRASRT